MAVGVAVLGIACIQKIAINGFNLPKKYFMENMKLICIKTDVFSANLVSLTLHSQAVSVPYELLPYFLFGSFDVCRKKVQL